MKKQWKWAIGIVLFCILAPIVLFATHIGMRSHAVNGGAAVAARFLEALRSHNYPAAYALMGPSEQAAVSVVALQRGQQQIEKTKGRWLSPAELNEYHPDDALDRTAYFYPMRNDCITYFYSVAPDHSDQMPNMVRSVHTDNGWRVLEYQYDGPA